MKKTLLLLLFTSLHFYLCSQTTIGSANSPNKGAILDLKGNQSSGGAVNSTKGLILPRVFLMSKDSLNEIIPDNTERPDRENHTALTVYNTNTCFSKGEGIYVWSGKEWFSIKNEPIGKGIVKDEEGNEYQTMSFGLAGVWMVENLRSTRFPSNTGKGTLENKLYTPNEKKAAYYYPAKDGQTGIGNPDKEAYLDKQPNLGLLYNWQAASNYRNDRPSGLGEYGEQHRASQEVVQGICPNGWHLPSDYEWTMLEKEIATNPHKYSQYRLGESEWIGWNNDWENIKVDPSTTTTHARPSGGNPAKSHGNAMKSPCEIIPGYTPTSDTYGMSLNPFDGGFNVVFAGSFNGDTGEGKTVNYGQRARFWTSSFSANRPTGEIAHDWIMSRVFVPASSGVTLAQQTQHWGFSVRCIKDWK